METIANEVWRIINEAMDLGEPFDYIDREIERSCDTGLIHDEWIKAGMPATMIKTVCDLLCMRAYQAINVMAATGEDPGPAWMKPLLSSML